LRREEPLKKSAASKSDASTPRPNVWFYFLLPLVHYASVKLTFSLAVSPENEVVVWLPNAVLLAALLHFDGRRGWLLALLTFSSDVIANLPVFPPTQAVLLSLCNLGEVTATWLLVRRLGGSPRLERIRDFGKFVLAGPVLGALGASLLAGGVLLTLERVTAPYPTLVLLWWFGDALGLLIFTPLLLALMAPASDEAVKMRWWDLATIVLTAALTAMIFTRGQGSFGQAVTLSPTLLLPLVLVIAVRQGPRWTAVAVALIALVAAWSQTAGHRPFGDASAHEMILHAQEFILTLSIAGMGFATLFAEQRALARELEVKVRERTQELVESNAKLAALSMTDSLTGIANRRRFDEALAAEWLRARRSRKPLTVGVVDVDFFKTYNDLYGHQAGDGCLRLVAEAISTNLRRDTDLAARYGGEEFVFVAPGVDAAGAVALAEAILAALRTKGHRHQLAPSGIVTASIGIAAAVPGEVETPELLLRYADQALYEAKRRGRDQVILFEPAMITDAPAPGAAADRQTSPEFLGRA
jgi:diguanylate cyclase (GGDEF)-like protein